MLANVTFYRKGTARVYYGTHKDDLASLDVRKQELSKTCCGASWRASTAMAGNLHCIGQTAVQFMKSGVRPVGEERDGW